MKRTAWAAPAALLALTLLTGCSDSGDGGAQVASVSGGPSAESSAGAGKSDAEQAQEFVDCMRENGVEMEDPDPATGKLDLQEVIGGGADATGFREAIGACRDKAPQSLQDAANGKPDAGQLEQMKKFAQCMRDNGVEMADPGPEGFDRESIDVNAPGFQDAMDACRDLLTSAAGGGR